MANILKMIVLLLLAFFLLNGIYPSTFPWTIFNVFSMEKALFVMKSVIIQLKIVKT